METENKADWDRFCRLGEMIGDGLHYEEPWISKEYKKLAKILLPLSEEEKEYYKRMRKIKNENIDKQIFERLKTDRCSCGSELKQTRSGSKAVVCISCTNRYKYSSTKKRS